MQVEERRDCGNCGAVLAADARFCQRCGAPTISPASAPEPDAVDGAAPSPAGPPDAALYWGKRAAVALLVAVTAAAVLFAIAALFFGAFVD